MREVAAACMPALVGVILLFGFVRGVPVFDAFLEGAKEGLAASVKVLPTLVGLITAVSVARASGLLDLVCALARPLTDAVGLAPELAPLAALRPVSGGGASAYALSILERFGPDSETGKIASVLAASTETTFYALAVYFGSVGVKKTRYALPAALLGDAAAMAFSVLSVRLMG